MGVERSANRFVFHKLTFPHHVPSDSVPKKADLRLRSGLGYERAWQVAEEAWQGRADAARARAA